MKMLKIKKSSITLMLVVTLVSSLLVSTMSFAAGQPTSKSNESKSEASEGTVFQMTFGDYKYPDGLDRVEIKQPIAVTVPITAKDANGNVISSASELNNELGIITPSNVTASITKDANGNPQLQLDTSKMSEEGNVIVIIYNKTLGKFWSITFYVQKPAK